MRKRILFSLAALLVVGAVVGWQTLGQNGAKAQGKADPSLLPIRQVVLFNSGVSYFQREGEVDGNVRIDLSFPTNDINDLLKSMILQDLGGGKVSTVSYDSHDPIEKVLRSFALDLNNNPTYSQILNQARGEKIEITRHDKKELRQVGIIVGVEIQKRQLGKDTLVDVDYLNLVAETGFASIPLEQVASIRFLNPVLDSEFQRALRVVASSHDTQKKSVSLGFNGQGKRAVRVGYVVEHPIWKTSYRLSIAKDGKVAIQGWAVVENTSDDDWNEVNMSLVSGRPISFKMNLYEPLYVPRPTVEPELFASLRPPVYSSAIGDKESTKKVADDANDKQSGRALKDLKKSEMREELAKAAEPKPGDAKDLDEYRAQKEKKQSALNFHEGVSSMASASELGEYYQYALDQKITLARQKSAMLPILDQAIAAAKVSIYNESVQAKFPLLGLRLKNSAGQPLNQGPITVYEEGSYAGDTRILDLAANDERLLSYALDQAVEIKTDVKSSPSPDMHFRIDEANLTANYKLRQTRTYTIKNRAVKERIVILEHPIRPDWKLIDSQKPLETTRDLYRFQVRVPADKTVAFDVIEDQARVDGLVIQGEQPTYVAVTGINVKALTQHSPDKLLSLKINKGFLQPTLKSRESKTFFIQNDSDMAREFAIDHIVRAEWVRLGDKGETQRGPDVYSFVLKVPQGKTASREIIQERTHQEKGSLVKTLPEERIREYLASPVPSADVKRALSKILAMRGTIAETRKTLGEQEHELKQLSDDQARLRENLKIIPQTSEPYKKFLDKFVAQEGEIETYQKRIRQLQATLQVQQRDFDAYVEALTEE